MKKWYCLLGFFCLFASTSSFWMGTDTVEAKSKDTGKFRTPEQVVADWQSALDREDWADLVSNYDDPGVVISDVGILVGSDDIVTYYQSYVDLFSGVNHEIL